MQSKEEKSSDQLAKELVAELDYLLKEGFLRLKNLKEPTIALDRGVKI